MDGRAAAGRSAYGSFFCRAPRCPIVQLQKSAWTSYEGVVLYVSLFSYASARNVPFSVAGLFSRANMDPQIRRWLIAMAIAIILFAIGMAMSISHLI
jgi:hypothetical protein